MLARLVGGEVEAIARLSDVLLIVDDAPARCRARVLTGTLRVLRRGKVAGHIDRLESLIAELGVQGFRVHPALVEGVLRDVGELDD